MRLVLERWENGLRSGPPGRLALRLGLAAAAAQRRRLRRVVFIGVTGSSGKTTTKELIAAVLETRLTGNKTPGLGNRLSIVGRTILGTSARDAFCVVEVATWRPGAVAQIARLVQPRIAVVTNVGYDHRSAFRTLEAVAAEKRELVAALPSDGVAILNADDPFVSAMAEGFQGRVVTFGQAPEADVRAEDVRSAWPDRLTFTLHVDGRSLHVATRLCGKYWVSSVLAALAVGRELGIPLEDALVPLAAFEPMDARMNPVVRAGVTFIRDDAKAPPWSFGAALEFLAEARAARKIMVIGTLSDHAGTSSRNYAAAARRALDVVDQVVVVGPNAVSARKVLPRAPDRDLRIFATLREAAEHFDADLREGDLVLLKGSTRPDHLHRLILARTGDVQCWRSACGRSVYCDSCSLLHVPG